MPEGQEEAPCEIVTLANNARLLTTRGGRVVGSTLPTHAILTTPLGALRADLRPYLGPCFVVVVMGDLIDPRFTICPRAS